ncbi:helix-turn-helix transcriptional regulator [Streptomyces sp. NPDC002734]|uniref:helix-turn-helix transcriptional regulator n=1 Tax=Streptomyces sp. NPDC002734 TaxID=3154426 RepID=UPI00332B84A1
MPSAPTDFAALLHAWRDRLSPADAGITVTTGRRAPGLRREELAQLAGISVDHVLRLEQGRAKNPSAQVVGALARALRLTRAERDQLHRSAGLLPPRDGTVGTHVPPGVRRLVERLDDVPAGVFAADWTLLCWNPAWSALHGDPCALPAAERNLARALFGGGAARARTYAVRSERGADAFAASLVADLKDAASRCPEDRDLARLLSELRDSSPDFDRLWSIPTAAAGSADALALDLLRATADPAPTAPPPVGPRR